MKTRDRGGLHAVLIAAIPLLSFCLYGLFDLDEGFYGAIAAEMMRKGEWITPLYNGHPWFEKPILLYWAAIPFMKVFGTWVGARMPSVVASLIAAWGVNRFAKRHMGGASSQLAVLFLAGMPLWAFLGRMMMTDTLLAMAVGMSLMCWWDAKDRPSSAWAAGIWMGIGLLAKGPIAMILVLGTLFWAAILIPEWRRRIRAPHILAVPLAVLVGCLWFWPAYNVNGQVFIQKFFVEQNLSRFAGGDTAHTQKGLGIPFYYVVVALVGMAPLVWRPKAWLPKRNDGLGVFLLLSAVVPFVFFTITAAKLPHYILPCCIPLALLGAKALSGQEERPLFSYRGATVAFVITASLANIMPPFYYYLSGQAELHWAAQPVKGSDLPFVIDLVPGGPDPTMGFVGMRETSHPSLLFETGKTAIMPKFSFEKEGVRGEDGVLTPYPVLVLTRSSVTKDKVEAVSGQAAEGLSLTNNYAVYRVGGPLARSNGPN